MQHRVSNSVGLRSRISSKLLFARFCYVQFVNDLVKGTYRTLYPVPITSYHVVSLLHYTRRYACVAGGDGDNVGLDLHSLAVFSTPPVVERLARVPPPPPRLRDRATTAPQSVTGEITPPNAILGEEPSPVPDMAGDRKNMEIPIP